MKRIEWIDTEWTIRSYTVHPLNPCSMLPQKKFFEMDKVKQKVARLPFYTTL
jgi:hypothetical protein